MYIVYVLTSPCLYIAGVGKAGGAASDGEYENSLVSALVQPSGMKVTVPEGNKYTF